MKKIYAKKSFFVRWFLPFFVFFCCGTGCLELQKNNQNVRTWMHERSRIKVLVTTEYVACLVKDVGGDQVTVLTLIPAQSDPHSYQIVKGDDAKFRSADIVFYSGLMLEQGASLIKYLQKYHAHSVGDYIQKKTGKALMNANMYDPHIWHDIGLFAEGLFFIAEQLSLIRPEKAAYFQENAKKAYERYQVLHRSYQEELVKIDPERRYLVTTHDAFRYFTRAYLATDEERNSLTFDHRCIAPEGFSPEAQISTKDLQKSIDFIVQHNIHVVFSEATVNQDSLNKIREVLAHQGYIIYIDEDSLYSDTMGKEDTLESVFLHNAQQIRDSIKEKRCDAP